MPATLIGAHMPTDGSIANAVRNGKAIGCTAVQVFTKSPRMWNSAPLTEEKILDFKAAVTETGISSLVSHDSYLINLADPRPEGAAKGYDGLKGELERCAELGIPYVVSHMGAHMGEGEEVGLKRVIEATNRLLQESPDSVTLLMETTAGQGSSLNYRFEHLRDILDGCHGHPRLAVCLDTCHIFAAGYDIRTDETFNSTFKEFNDKVGFDRLKVVHCNDSKKALGSKVDRHDNLGDGEIGQRAFELLVRDPRFERIPIVVETPSENDGHAKNTAKLWAWSKG